MKRKAALAALAATFAPLPAPAQPSRTPYKIGATFPLTGAFAATAAEYLPALELAAAKVNKAGGVNGHPLQVAVEDSQASPQGGIAAMRKLVQVDGVQCVATLFTNVVTAQVPLSEQLQIPILTIAEVAGVLDDSPYAFGHATRSTVTDPLLGAYWQKHGFKRIYGFAANSSQGRNQVPSWRDLAQRYGVEFDAALLALDDTDFRGALARAKDFNPDGILLNTSGSGAEATVLRQARELGMQQQFFADSNFYTVHAWREAVGPYAEGMIFGGDRVDVPAARDFVRAYRARLGFLPGYPAGEMYDILNMFAAAIARGGYTGAGIRTALTTLKGIPSTLGGSISMGADRYTVISGIALWKVRRGDEVKVG